MSDIWTVNRIYQEEIQNATPRETAMSKASSPPALVEILTQERFRSVGQSEWGKNAGMGWELRVVYDHIPGVRWWLIPGRDSAMLPGRIACACVDLMRRIEAALAQDAADREEGASTHD